MEPGILSPVHTDFGSNAGLGSAVIVVSNERYTWSVSSLYSCLRNLIKVITFYHEFILIIFKD